MALHTKVSPVEWKFHCEPIWHWAFILYFNDCVQLILKEHSLITVPSTSWYHQWWISAQLSSATGQLYIGYSELFRSFLPSNILKDIFKRFYIKCSWSERVTNIQSNSNLLQMKLFYFKIWHSKWTSYIKMVSVSVSYYGNWPVSSRWP